MPRKMMMLSAALFMAMTTNSFAAEQATSAAATDETFAVEQAVGRYYAALNAVRTGDASGMDDVWSHTDTITYMGPIGGIETGWDALRLTWQEQATMKFGGHVTPTNLHVTVGDDLATVECYEIGTLRGSGPNEQAYRLRATSSLRKENGQWKMIGHHTDLLDELDSNTERATTSNTTGWDGPQDDQAEKMSDDDSIDVSDAEVELRLEQ